MEILFDPYQQAGKSHTIEISQCSLSFQWCPPGKFLIGSPDNDSEARFNEKPQMIVLIPRGFWVGTFPVTQEVWLCFMEEKSSIVQPGDNLPASGMTWQQACTFCSRLTEALRNEDRLQTSQSISLSSEAQWEYAARAETLTRWYFGDKPDQLDEHAWYDINSGRICHSVGEKQPNPWGLYDVYGNVSEWCLNDYHSYKTFIREGGFSVQTNSSRKVARGGSCIDTLTYCCSPARYNIGEINPYNDEIGLRIILEQI